ncbi:hypothetical protein AB833_06505 [Chromatiales bacterium (ex Bugula neritina AB1)]|nr:hypothetical protein AB833_06505 [Chromatiales bacterium (ex Bugula neritina AB1)]
MEPLVIVFAFFAGLLFRRIGYPPLLGYLLAGFLGYGLELGSGEQLKVIADIGITLLLFTIGLKLNPKDLSPRYVWGSAILHMVVAVPLTAAVILIVGLMYEPLSFDSPFAAWTLAFALSFSSTVLAIKLFEDRGESNSHYASIAIGVLIVQDVMAVLYLVLSSGHLPSPWALLLFALPLARPLIARLLQVVGHGELLVLSGVMFALAAAQLFEIVDLKGGLGALVCGCLLRSADKAKSKEIYDCLSNLKNLLLVGFFVAIGYNGIPSMQMVGVAVVLSMLIVLRPIIYFALLTFFGLRARTGWLSGLSLFSYSEFGLIVAAIAVEKGVFNADWITTLALAMSLSFFLATPINNKAHLLYRRYQSRLRAFENPVHLPEEQFSSLGDATTVVLGMGRIGTAAYDILRESGRDRIVALEENYDRTQRLCTQGYNCVHGDASDRDFWESTDLASREMILVSLSNHREELIVVELAREFGCVSALFVATRFQDHKEHIEALGCNAFYLYDDVGRDFGQYSLAIKRAESS